MATKDSFFGRGQSRKISKNERKLLLDNSYLSLPENQNYVIDVDELLHGAPRPIGEPYHGMRCLWTPWKALSDPDLLEILVNIAEDEINKANKTRWDWPDFDIICSMSATASPVAAILSVRYRKPLFYSDNRTLQVLPEKPNRDARILLIDSLVSSGSHVFQMMGIFWDDEFSPDGFRRVNVFSFALDDLTRFHLPIVSVWNTGGKLCYSYKLSEIRDLWRASLDKQFGN
jgi:hypothetical protein